MKLATCLAAATLLAGCSSFSPWSSMASRSHGSWLDAVGRPANPPLVMTDEHAGYLLQQAAQLRSESDAMRARLAGEPDRLQRLRHYQTLRELGDQLAPIERDLRDSGRPTRASSRTAPPA